MSLSATARFRPLPRPALFALSVGGVAFTLVQLIVGTSAGLFPIPAGDELIWDRVGDAIWTGTPIYYNAPNLTDSFWYSPPLAIVLGMLSWMPVVAQHWVFTVVRIASLRVIAGSWLGAGIACWFPLVAFELGGGNFNLLIAAGIVAAVLDRRPELAVLGGLAKFGPLLAIDRRDWRSAAVILLAMLAITLPWLYLWPQWASHLLGNLGTNLGLEIPIPLSIRLIVAALLLIGVRTAWARALAATIAIPAFYWGSLVVLIAPVAVLIRNARLTVAPGVPRPEPAT